MPASVKGTPNAAAGTSVAIPAHAIGDLIVLFVYRDGSTTLPTKPGASGTVPAWVDINAAAGANTNCSRTAYFQATATNHTTGTWTGATGIVAAVIQGHNSGNAGADAIGGHAEAGSTANGSSTAPAVTLANTDSTSVLLEFHGHRSVTAWNAAPSGYTRQAAVATEVCCNTKNDTTTDGSIAQTGTTTNSGYRGAAVEIKAMPIPSASASGAHDWDSALVGAADYQGSVSAGHDWGSDVVGSADYLGTVAANHGWQSTLTGEVEHRAAATATHGWNSSVVGEAEHRGAAAAALDWASTVVGETPPDVSEGTISATHGWDSTVVGETPPEVPSAIIEAHYGWVTDIRTPTDVGTMTLSDEPACVLTVTDIGAHVELTDRSQAGLILTDVGASISLGDLP